MRRLEALCDKLAQDRRQSRKPADGGFSGRPCYPLRDQPMQPMLRLPRARPGAQTVQPE